MEEVLYNDEKQKMYPLFSYLLAVIIIVFLTLYTHVLKWSRDYAQIH